MAASSFLNRKPLPAAVPRFACRTCQDGGLIPIEGAVQTEKYADTFKNNVPCVCATGDFWRREFELRENPPACACGRTAIYRIPSNPVCAACDAKLIKQYLETRVRSVDAKAPELWKGWQKVAPDSPAASVAHGGPSGERSEMSFEKIGVQR